MRAASPAVSPLVAAVLLLLAAAACTAPAAGPSQGPVQGPGPRPAPGRAPAAPARGVDVHVHLVTGRGSQEDYPGAIDEALREMDRFGIATAIVLPPPQVDGQAFQDARDYAAALRRHPGRFAYLAGGGSLNAILHRHADPATVTDRVKQAFVAEAERALDQGATGFGEMASLHLSVTTGHPYEFVPADHPLLLALADVAAKRGAPIDLHMDPVDGGMPAPRNMPGAANPPTLPDTLGALPRLLAHNAGARIAWAHGGSDPLGAMSPATVGRLMDAHPNLFVSLRIVGAQAPMHHKVFSGPGVLDPAWQALLVRHADRLVIGSDSFFASPGLRGVGPGLTFGAHNTPKLMATAHFLSLLSPEVARKIGRDNAARIYRLSPR